jgi:hypothetical protein
MTKNITLALDEVVLEKARVIAARRKTTINAMVREHLAQLVDVEGETRKALMELRELSERTKARLGDNYRFDRDAANAR